MLNYYTSPETFTEKLSMFFSKPNALGMGSQPGELNEELVTQKKREKDWRMNCDVGKAMEGLDNEL